MKTADQLANRINDATRGLIDSYSKRLGELSPKYISVICDYIFALKSEIKLSNGYRKNILNTLIVLSAVGKNKNRKGFKDFTRNDIVTYLNRFRKEDSVDPTHKWIGTYNLNLINICKFFKWLYFPNVEPTKREKPEMFQNLPKLRRLEKSSYEPNDMWDAEDNLLFLKYCPISRDRCYHSMTCDTSARPHELLNLKIKDVEFIEGDKGRYAKILVNGKTGQRSLPLIDSIPYVTQWISEHPQRDNGESLLLSNLETGGTVQQQSIHQAYVRHKKYFTKLLSRDIPEEDKKKIKNLLKKPWNPYVHRHSALTEKSGILSSDSMLRQHAGWTPSSNMHIRYVHFRGGESMQDLLKIKGVIKEGEQSVNILTPKICPSCKHQNTPDSQYCFKCNFVMDFTVYQKSIEEKERKEQEILKMRKDLDTIANLTYRLLGEFKRSKGLTEDEIPRLTDHEYNKLDHIFSPEKNV